MDAQMPVAALLAELGNEIEDVDQEVFEVFSQPVPSQDLGMVDGKANTLELSVCGKDFVIAQSPGLLQSKRAGGTTGAVVWRTSVKFAEWAGWPKNPLFAGNTLNETSTILELGAGISGILPCLMSPKVRKIVATDQGYVLKALQENVENNTTARQPAKGRKKNDQKADSKNIEIVSLDWEHDDVASVLSYHGLDNGVDALLACDCIFNYALIDPLVQACVDICRLRRGETESEEPRPTLCVIAQQLRQPEVFEQWLTAFHRQFRVWRVPDDLLTDELKEGSGFVIHIGFLRHTT